MIALNTATETIATATETVTSVLEDISTDELMLLKQDIDKFLSCFDVTEELFCEGSAEYEDCRIKLAQKASALKERIRGLAIATGVHREFLQNYDASCKRNGFKLALVSAEF